MNIKFNDWINYENNFDEWIGKIIYKINFSIFDITYNKYVVLDKKVNIKNREYLLLSPLDDLGFKIPFYEMYDMDNSFVFKTINDLEKSKDDVIDELLIITNTFFNNTQEHNEIKELIIDQINSNWWSSFIKNKYYKFF